jgi:WD40 repeat protein
MRNTTVRRSRSTTAVSGRLLVAFWIGLLLGPAPAPAQDRPSQEEQELRRQLAIERSARKALTYAADMRKAAQLVEGERWDALRAILNEYRPGGGETDLREWEWHFLNALAGKNQLVDPRQLAPKGSSDPIEQLAWSGDGRRLAGLTSEGAVVIWDAKTGGLLRRVEGKAKWVCLDRDGQRLAIGHQWGPASLAEVETGRQIRAFDPVPRQGAERPIAFSPDGKLLALGVDDSSAMIVDAATGKDLRRLAGHQGFVTAISWDASGERLATGGGDGMIYFWDVASAKQTASLNVAGRVLGLQWRQDGRQIALATLPHGNGWVRIWDLAQGEVVFSAECPSTNGNPVEVRLSPDGQRVAAKTITRSQFVWDISKGLTTFEGPNAKENPTGNDAQAAGCDHQVRRVTILKPYLNTVVCRVVDVVTKDEVLRGEAEIRVNDFNSTMAWSRDGRRLATGFSRGKASIHDMPTGHGAARSLNIPNLRLFEWSPDGKRFAFSINGDVRIGGLPFSRPAMALTPPDSTRRLVRKLAWAPDGRSLATVAEGDSRDCLIEVWDAVTGKKTRSVGIDTERTVDMGGMEAEGTAIAWSPDNRSLAWAGKAIQVLNLESPAPGRTLRRVRDTPGTHGVDHSFLAWSPDNRSFVVVENRRTSPQDEVDLSVWNLDTGQAQSITNLPSLDWYDIDAPCAWSPDGKRLAWGGSKAAVWNLALAREEFALTGHRTPVYDVQWSPEGRRVLSRSVVRGALEKTFELKVWDAANGEEVLMLRGRMAGWLVAPGFGALASPRGLRSDETGMNLWDLGPRE